METIEPGTLYLTLGFLVVAGIAIGCLLLREWKIDREIRAKEKFLEDNPAPKKIIRFMLHDN